MDKRLSVSTQIIEACDGDIGYIMSKGEYWKVSVSEAELERCAGRIEQSTHNCANDSLRTYLSGAAAALRVLHDIKREDDEDKFLDSLMMKWKAD